MKIPKTFRSFTTFSKWSAEKQARYIERETEVLVKRLPSLKKNLQMYGEISDELYNLEPSELRQIGETYASAVRTGEITTPASKNAYRRFINQIKKYARRDMARLAQETAERRLESWLDNVKANGSTEEIEYAEFLLEQMTDSQKIGFTLSKYFLDVENWSSEGFIKSTSEGLYSIQVLKLELFLQNYEGIEDRNIYNQYVATDGDINAIRNPTRHKPKRPRKKK